ncbi:MAG: efflux RND transporter permease subunit [Muribaculaceae bacterium]|nr:efflux RND transporter permease subunit [Muribaculaceae bacterium]
MQAQANKTIDERLDFDRDNIKLEWGGQFENQSRAYSRLGVVVPLALAVMLILLIIALGKIRMAFTILMVIPLAIFGGMLALNVRGMTLNVSSAVGFIALFGVAIQNGVIMLSHINDLRKQRGDDDLKSIVVQGARHRFRPILMTASVAVLGLLPASLSTNIGSDVQRPLATVIVYGLLFATVVTLFVLPVIYYAIEKHYLTTHKK